MCRVNADVFPGSLNSKLNTDIVIAMIVADAVKLTQTQSELGDSQSVIRTTLFSLSQTNYHSNHRYNDSEMCYYQTWGDSDSGVGIKRRFRLRFRWNRPGSGYYNPLHRSRRFINQYFRLTDQNAKCLLETMPCASRRKVPGCVPDVRIEVSRAA